MHILIPTEKSLYVTPNDYGKVIALVALAYLIPTLDLSMITITLHSIGLGLEISSAALSWVVSAYALTLSGFLMLCGRASDIYSQRRCLLLGLVLFGLGSFLSAFAVNIDMLIVTRAMQGLGGAFVVPACFSLINLLLPEGEARHRALGMLGIMQGLSLVLGVVLGGVVATNIGWRPCFFINLPLIAIACILTWQVVPRETTENRTEKLDLLGAILICISIALILRALSQTGKQGFLHPQACGLLIVGFFVCAMFILHESRVTNPILPLSVFKCRGVVPANLIIWCIGATGLGMFLMVSTFMQTVLKFSAMNTGFAMLPYALAVMTGGRIARFTMEHHSLRTNIMGAISVALLGMLLLSVTALVAPGYVTCILPGIAVFGIGVVIAFVSLLSAGTIGAPAHQQGVASALIMTSNQIGFAIGSAITLTVFGTHFAHGPVNEAFAWAFGTNTGILIVALIIVIAGADIGLNRVGGSGAG
jgi:MFS transporter, DHA2 family, methylenomycin A resistance protein